MDRIQSYSPYLQERYGGKTYKVAVDAGFTCPGREHGDPCAYCDSSGSRAPYLGDREAIRSQVERGIEFLGRRYGAKRFLLFFQAFSNTYAPVAKLREIYDEGLACGEFAGLVVATRPDCIDEERARLLASYLGRGYDVWVELGLQTANETTLARVSRGHSRAQFEEAVRLLKRHRINVAAHLILGLPGDGLGDAAETARFVSRLGIDGVKFHNLVLKEGTELYRDYLQGNVEPVTVERYLELLIAALEHLRPGIVVMRLTCDPLRGTTHVPASFPAKSKFYGMLDAAMQERSTFQGRLWTELDEQSYKAEEVRCAG